MFKNERHIVEEKPSSNKRANTDTDSKGMPFSAYGSRHSPTLSDIENNSLKAEGMRLARKGDFKEALATWQELLELYPHDSSVHELCAQALLELNEPWQAIHAAQRAAHAEPDNVDAYVTLGRAQLNIGDKRLAAKTLVTAMNLDRSNSSNQTDMHQAREYLRNPLDPCQTEENFNFTGPPESKNKRIAINSCTLSRDRLAHERLFGAKHDNKHHKSNNDKSNGWTDECRQEKICDHELEDDEYVKKVGKTQNGLYKYDSQSNNIVNQYKNQQCMSKRQELVTRSQRGLRGAHMFNLNEQVENVRIQES